jgi:hypothetical protein
MKWFMLGAGISVAQLSWSLIRRPLGRDAYYLQGFVFAAIAGAAIYGTALWLLSPWIMRLMK